MLTDELTKTKIVYNFWNTCYRCFKNIEYPLLGDFSYGELLFQTTDGQDFYYVMLIDNKTFEFICNFLKSSSDEKVKKLDPQKVLVLLADKPENKEFSINYPLCPNCNRRQNHFNDNVRGSQRVVKFAQWIGFEKLTEENKYLKLKDIISLNLKALK